MYSAVKKAVRKIVNDKKEAYIRQEYDPGDVCEFDWGTVKLDINDAGYKKYYMAVFTPAFSNYRYSILFRYQDTAAFQEAHAIFLEHCKGSFKEFVYDNMRVAIRNFVGLTEKEPTEALLGLSIYYGFNFRFTNIYRGNEKGHVEKSVDVVRNNAFSLPGTDKFPSLAAANEYLLEQCNVMNNERISNETIPAVEFEKEQRRLLPWMPKFECCVKSDNKVDKYSTITVNLSHYSVPDTLVGKRVSVKAYTDKIYIFNEGAEVAVHDRSCIKFDWVIDIMHYLRTLSKKPGALKRSSALLQADTQIKKLYEKYYSKDAKTFLRVLEIIKEHGIESVINAIRKVERFSPTDISYDKIKSICDYTHEESTNIVYISDYLTDFNRNTLPQYDRLFKTGQIGGVSNES